MNRQIHDVLKYIYERNKVEARVLMSSMERRDGDHRDFYPLAALINDGFIGFSGPIPKAAGNDGAPSHIDAYQMSRLLQCYSQGTGSQGYQGVSIFNEEGRDSTFFIAAKGLLYFHEYLEKRRGWWQAAFLGLGASIIAGCVTGWLATLVR
ncbi:hypothetical protein [Pseudomonas orientalis]|uniref:Uncharacterized protein n=1 Tax=Pseudomonas orientalis TaxID=76758 RepID=A0A4Q7D034_9PSED|nr:hypothetical protein [Pseudomonas orientalis]RZI31142.1 hypothetical protein EUX57_14085 [Pseudomonas orientalis]